MWWPNRSLSDLLSPTNETSKDTEEEETNRSAEGAIFTATKCPPKDGLKNSCELPYGFLWTPMAACNQQKKDDDDENRIVVDCNGEALPPVICLTCLAYINLYAKVDYETGTWICPLCDQENVAPIEDLNGKLKSALTLPVIEYHQEIPNEDGKEDGDDDEKDTRTIILVVDTNLSGDDGRAIADALEESLTSLEGKDDEFSKLRIGLVVFDETVAMYQLGLLGIASSDVYTPIDPDDDEALLQRKAIMEERAYLKDIDSVSDLDSLRRCISATFGVSIETEKTEPASRLEFLRRRKEDRLLAERQQNGADKDKHLESPWVKHRQNYKKKNPKRCVGEAIQCAIDLTVVGHPVPSRTSQILLFTNGCPNIGGGSVATEEENKKNSNHAHDVVDTVKLSKALEYFETTAAFALETGVGVDVFCSGVNELGLPAYQSLVEPSGGYVLSHSTFNSPQLKRNFTFVLQESFMSRSTKDKVGETKSEEAFDWQCLLDIRTDSFMTPSNMNGPGELLTGNVTDILENERSSFAMGASLATNKGMKTDKLPLQEALDISMTRVNFGRADPYSTVAVLVELNDSFVEGEDTHAFFQLTARYIDRNGKKLITRVCTYRFEVATDVGEFVESTESEALAVILGKIAVYRTLHGREETDDVRDRVVAGDTDLLEKLAHETQLDIDATIQRISGAFRLLDLGSSTRRPSSSSLDSAFPPRLKRALNFLYHLRRGPLISPGPMKSMDDRAEIRGLFLRFPLEECIRMMAPTLWSTGSLEDASMPTVEMQKFPANTLALWDDSIIAGDFYDYLFVWTGKHCEGVEYNGIREDFKNFLVQHTSTRFPLPQVQMIKDGDSMSRRFTAQLAPSHADSDEHQIAHFPALASLSSKSLASLRSKFNFYEATADASFQAWFWNVSSATNVSREDGMSLCD